MIQGDKVIVRIGEPDQNGNTEISLQSGFKDTFIGGTKIKDATDTVAALISNNPGLANNPEALLQQLLTSGLTPDTDLVGLFVNGFGLVQGVSNPLVGNDSGGSDTRGRHVVRERLA